MAGKTDGVNPDQPAQEAPRADGKKAPDKARFGEKFRAIVEAVAQRKANSAAAPRGGQPGWREAKSAPDAAAKPGEQEQDPPRDRDIGLNGFPVRSPDWRPDWAGAGEGGGRTAASNLTPVKWTPETYRPAPKPGPKTNGAASTGPAVSAAPKGGAQDNSPAGAQTQHVLDMASAAARTMQQSGAQAHGFALSAVEAAQRDPKVLNGAISRMKPEEAAAFVQALGYGGN